MNTPTETLADFLCGEPPLMTTEASRRLLAQHAMLTKQDERIAELEKELEEVRGYYTSALDSERMWRAKAERYWQELEQERQDRKQADLDTIRALGERNDARKELAEWKDKFDASEQTHAATRADLADCKLALESERALADRLACELESWGNVAGKDAPSTIDEPIAQWKEARRE